MWHPVLFLLIAHTIAHELEEEGELASRPLFGQQNNDVELINTTTIDEGMSGAIVAGKEAKYEKIPYQLQLALNGRHICGASVIGKNWAITAAHCVDGENPDKVTVRAGAVKRNTGGRVHSVSKIIIHPRFDDDDYDYDVALLKVRDPFQFGRHVQKIELPAQGEFVLPEGAPAVASGWGYLEEDGDPSATLQYVVLAIVSRKKCAKALGKFELYITDRMFCAGFAKGGRDTCQGDSGGPLASNGKLIGIVSWGVGCARPGFPGVYTRLNKLRYWIKDHTGI